MKNRWFQYLIVYLVILILLTAIWISWYKNALNREYVKTSATVVRIVPHGTMVGDGSLGGDSAVYEYRDSTGKKHTYFSDDGFNFITKLFVGVKAGDKKTAYFNKINPSDVIIAHGLGYLLILSWPLVFGLLPVLAAYIILISLARYQDSKK